MSEEAEHPVNITFKSGATVTVHMFESEFEKLRQDGDAVEHFERFTIARTEIVLIKILK